MRNFKEIFYKNVFLFLSQITNPAWSFILSSIVVSLGSVSLYGQYVLLQSYASLIFTIFFSGLNQYVTRFSPTIKSPRRLSFTKKIIVIIFIILILLLVVSLLISILFLNSYYLAVLLCITLIINNLLASFLNGFLKRRDLFLYISLLLLVKTISILILFYVVDDVTLLSLVITISVSSSVFIFLCFRKYITLNLKYISDIRKIFIFSWPYTLTGIVAWAAQSIDKIYLSLFFGSEPLGLYGIYYLLVVTPVMILGQVFHLYALPQFYSNAEGHTAFHILLFKCMGLVGLIASIYIIGFVHFFDVVRYFYRGIGEFNSTLVLLLLIFSLSQVLASYAEAVVLKYRQPVELMSVKLLGYGAKFILMVVGAWTGGLSLMLGMAVVAHCAIVVGFSRYYNSK